MSPIMPGIVASGFRTSGGGPGPGAGAHRYWRVRVTATLDAQTRAGINILEFWGNPWCERLFGTAFASSQGGSRSAATTQGETYEIASGSDGTWVSSEADATPHIGIDLGDGNAREVGGIAIWRPRYVGSEQGPPSAFTVQYSDDDSVWTDAWSDTADYAAGLTVPHQSLNPSYGGDDSALLDRQSDVAWWLDAANSFSDAGTTPASAADPVQQITNLGTVGTPFAQSTLGNRPIYRTGGLNGLPYLECDPGGPHYLEDIAWSNVSGTTSITPWAFAAAVDLAGVPAGTQALMGSTVSGGGKNAVLFRNPSGAQHQIASSDHRAGNIITPMLLAGTIWSYNRAALLRTGTDGDDWLATLFTSASAGLGGAVSATQLFRATGISGSAYLDGDVYELLIVPAAGSAELPFANRMRRYLQRKYGTT